MHKSREGIAYVGTVLFAFIFILALFWMISQRQENGEEIAPEISPTSNAASESGIFSALGANVSEAIRGSQVKNNSKQAILVPSNAKKSAGAIAPSVGKEVATCPFLHAASPSRAVIISELAWMGGGRRGKESASAAAGNEWIELKSLSTTSIRLAGWKVQDESGKINVDLEGTISGGGYYLLERGDDDSAPSYSANSLYSATLPNDGAHIHIYDTRCQLVDDLDMSSGWAAGNNEDKRTMERSANNFSWHTSINSGGTPGKANSTPKVFALAVSGQATSLSFNPAQETEEIKNTYDVAICEVQTEGPSDAHEEFVEICNYGKDVVDVSDWYVQRKTKAGNWGTFAPARLFQGLKIEPGGTLVLAVSDSSIKHDISLDYGITADNSLVLKDASGAVVDLVGWGDASAYESSPAPQPPAGVSISRSPEGVVIKDTNNNLNDFLLCKSSPGAISVCEKILPASATTPSSTPPSENTAPSFVFVHELKITGGEGRTSEDHIILFNKGASPIDISGWKIRKRTSSGSESSIKVLPEGSIILPASNYIWANSGNNYAVSISANTSSTATLASNNSVGFLDEDGILVDAVAWGEELVNPFIEGLVFPTNPIGGQLLRRKGPDSAPQDTNNNAEDFEIISL